jgi:hypothetical protein
MLSGCATKVRQSDLDAWVGIPVEALDTHSFFLTVPMVKTITPSGVEIRNYANGADFSSCSSTGSATARRGYVSSDAFTTCSTNRIVCNNLFYIKNGKVLEYAPTGRCYTDETVRPQQRWERLRAS